MSPNAAKYNSIARTGQPPKLVRIIIIVAWIAIMALIFWFSSQPADESTVQSHSVDTVICRIVIKDFKTFTLAAREYYIGHVDKFVRKFAHFSEYALLGIFTWLALNLSFIPFISKRRPQFAKTTKLAVTLRFLAIPVLWCCLYSITDEIHQLFADGRYASPTDVLIDTSGALFGVLILLPVRNFIIALRHRIKKM